MTTTASYRPLHQLTASQQLAVTALAAGATHGEAAEEAGVHRVTVTRWARHHPAFIAELNRLRAEASPSGSQSATPCTTPSGSTAPSLRVRRARGVRPPLA